MNNMINTVQMFIWTVFLWLSDGTPISSMPLMLCVLWEELIFIPLSSLAGKSKLNVFIPSD